MERIALEAELRSAMTKGQRHKLRREDKVSTVAYGRGGDSLSLVVDGRALRQVLSDGGSNVLIDLTITGQGKTPHQETVMLKEIQRDMIFPERIKHVDFIRISMTDKIEVNVPLNFVGEAVGVKEGGVVQVLAREVTVKCLPGNIPEQYEVDVSGLNIGDSITAVCLELAKDVELVTLPETPLAQVVMVMPEEETVAGTANAAGLSDSD
ncbi:MAG TPA: 50S ribosomal protein L25 [Candidatus Limnocylindrales bacterium]|nr:50S ribosomal protein L25 [Candidatus Limnocylindrales bacterium]